MSDWADETSEFDRSLLELLNKLASDDPRTEEESDASELPSSISATAAEDLLFSLLCLPEARLLLLPRELFLGVPLGVPLGVDRLRPSFPLSDLLSDEGLSVVEDGLVEFHFFRSWENLQLSPYPQLPFMKCLQGAERYIG